MERLTANFDYKKYLTVYLYCTVFPLEKTTNGFFKCRLSYNKESGETASIEWIIPAEYLGDGGRVVASKDVYFARFLARTRPIVLKDEDGVELRDKYGNIRVENRLFLGKLIEFWNTRVFGVGSEPFETSK